MVNRAQVAELNRLYTKRYELQELREVCAKPKWWEDALENSFYGTGTRSDVMNGLGGRSVMAEAMTQAAQARFQALQCEIDDRIAALGGEV